LYFNLQQLRLKRMQEQWVGHQLQGLHQVTEVEVIVEAGVQRLLLQEIVRMVEYLFKGEQLLDPPRPELEHQNPLPWELVVKTNL
jgi:hypothetical protein